MSSRTKALLLVVLLLAFVNVPVVHGLWTDSRLDADGVTRATPAEPQGTAADRRVVVTFPSEVGEGTAAGSQEGLVTQLVRLDEQAYADAVADGTVEVTYLPDSPGTYRVEGQDDRLAVVGLLLANAAALLVLGLFLLVRARSRPELRLVATDDLRRTAPGGVLERVMGNEYRVVGDIEELSDGELVLDVGGRRVRVDLAGHANPASYQQSVEVRGVMVG